MEIQPPLCWSVSDFPEERPMALIWARAPSACRVWHVACTLPEEATGHTLHPEAEQVPGGNMKGVAVTARLSFCGPGKVRSIGLTAP